MGASESNAEALVEEGLRLYSQGRLDAALEKWRAALALAPSHPRAEAYIKYVEDNRAALDASFDLAGPEQEAAMSKTPDRMQPAAVVEEETDYVESTARIDVELLQSRVDESRRSRSSLEVPAINGSARNTPATLSPAVVEPLERTRKVTAPTLLPDDGGAAERGPSSESRGRKPTSPSLTEEDNGLAGEPHTLERVRKATAATLIDERPPPGRASKAPSLTVLPGEGRSEGTAHGRSRRLTPLTLMPGEGEPEPAHFAPLERTPVGVELPEPARLVRSDDDSRRTGVALEPPSPSEIAARGAEQDPDRVDSMLAGARQLWEQGTPEGSLWLCERILAIDPQHAEAKELLARNQQVLIEQCRRRIGDMRQVPVVQIPQHEIMWHKLDHRAGFLLSRVDGQLSFEDIVDVGGMQEFEAIRILSQLLTMGVIGPRR